MDGRNNKSLDDQMSVLTAKIDDLIQTCGRLQTENQQLSLEKNELAQSLSLIHISEPTRPY